MVGAGIGDGLFIWTEGGGAADDTHMCDDDLAVAVTNLQSGFPGITISGKLSEKDRAFWDAFMRLGPAPITVAGFVRSLLEGILDVSQRAGVTITLFSEGLVSGASKGIRVSVETTVPLSDQDKRPFSLTQAYWAEEGGLTVHVEAVVAPHRGRQFVQSSLLAQARQFNARKITLTASSIGGSQEGVFVWARYGFVPRAGDWNAMRRWGLMRLNDEKYELESVGKDLEKILLDPSPKAVRWVVYLSWRQKGGRTTFLNHMLSSNVSWKGELDLTDSVSLSWLETYLASGQPQQFEPLLPAISKEGAPPPEPEKEEQEEKPDPAESSLDEETIVAMLVQNIRDGYSTVEDLEAEYGKRPAIVTKVLAALKVGKT